MERIGIYVPDQREIINRVLRMANHGSEAKKMSKLYGLDVVNVTWDDNARNKGSVWGPCISDMTLQVAQNRMPVIRQPNYTDKTWDVRINKIPLIVGNEKKGNDRSSLRSINLKQYLENFDRYTTRKLKKRINLYRASKDSHVIMSSQCCFLPIEKSKETKFNVALYNYQSSKADPAVLVIVSTSKGTSAQIIEGGSQKLLFNNFGKKADFVGQRLTDNRIERGVSIQGEMTKEEKQDNVVVIIQVPLKKKPLSGWWEYNAPSQPKPAPYNYYNSQIKSDPFYDLFGGQSAPPSAPPMYGFGSGDFNHQMNSSNNTSVNDFVYVPQQQQAQAQSSFSFANQSNNFDDCCFGDFGNFSNEQSGFSFSNQKRSAEKANVEAAIVKVATKTVPSCICGADLRRTRAQTAYFQGSDVNCNKCRRRHTGNDFVYHCDKGTDHYLHKRGYDLCVSCAEEQLAFDELNGLEKIERDERYPIRVTLQYYKSTDNGVVNSDIIFAIAKMLENSRAQADFVGSLVTDKKKEGMKARPTEWVEEKADRNDDYGNVKTILKKMRMFDAYMAAFKENEVTDEVLKMLEGADDLKDVVPKLGPRIKLWKAIQKWQKSSSGVNFIESIAF